MTEEQAKEYLNNSYICCCPYGTSPTKCGDEKCEFGQAIRALIEERPQGEWNYIQAGMCVCPFCGAMPHKLYKNYCANCGALMKQD